MSEPIPSSDAPEVGTDEDGQPNGGANRVRDQASLADNQTSQVSQISTPANHRRWVRKSFTEGLIEAYHRLGGIEYLVWFGRKYPADFVRACSRMIPQEIRSSIGAEVTIVHTIPRTALDIHPPKIPIADSEEN